MRRALVNASDPELFDYQHVSHVRGKRFLKYGGRRVNALICTRRVPKGHLLFVARLRLLTGLKAIAEYEDQVHNRYEGRYDYPVLQIKKENGVVLAAALIEPTRDRDPRTLFYLMNHEPYKRRQSIMQPNTRYEIDHGTKQVHIAVIAARDLKRGDELTWRYANSVAFDMA